MEAGTQLRIQPLLFPAAENSCAFVSVPAPSDICSTCAATSDGKSLVLGVQSASTLHQSAQIIKTETYKLFLSLPFEVRNEQHRTTMYWSYKIKLSNTRQWKIMVVFLSSVEILNCRHLGVFFTYPITNLSQWPWSHLETGICSTLETHQGSPVTGILSKESPPEI